MQDKQCLLKELKHSNMFLFLYSRVIIYASADERQELHVTSLETQYNTKQKQISVSNEGIRITCTAVLFPERKTFPDAPKNS